MKTRTGDERHGVLRVWGLKLCFGIVVLVDRGGNCRWA